MRRNLLHSDDVRNSFSTLKPFFLLSALSFKDILEKANLFTHTAQSPCSPSSSFFLNYTLTEQKGYRCYLGLRQARK